MSVTATDGLFIFLVDTTEYAGNFERELTAFCTGVIGDCGVGDQYAERFKQDCPKMIEAVQRLVAQVPDEHGNLRPTTVWPTPGYWNDGMGTHWKDEDWGKPETITTYREAIKTHRHYTQDLDPETALPGRHTAHQSVAMFFYDRPSGEILSFLTKRARAWKPIGAYDQANIPITGFRLIQVVKAEQLLWNTGPTEPPLPPPHPRDDCPACLYGDCFNPEHQ